MRSLASKRRLGRPLVSVLALAVVLGAGVPPAEAQPRSHWSPGYDPDTMTVGEALDYALARPDRTPAAGYVALWAGDTADPAYAPRLKALVEVHHAGPYAFNLTVALLDALWRVGEPEAYFVGLARDWRRRPQLAEAAIYVLARAPRADLIPELEAIAEGLGHSNARSRAMDHRRVLLLQTEFAVEPLSEKFETLFYLLSSAVESTTVTNDGRVVIFRGGVGSDLDPLARWAEGALAALARAHPTAVRAFLDGWTTQDYFAGYEEIGPGLSAAAAASFRAYTEGVAFPGGFPAPPPSNAAADVRPILECVTAMDTALVAHFGYENLSGAAVTVPYGAANRLSPAAYDGEQPEVFFVPGTIAGRPGRTPRYPESAYRVRFRPGERVTWTLAGRTSAAATDSPALRCGTYDPEAPARPDLATLTAAVTASAPALTARFTNSGVLISGRDYGLNGTLVSGATPVRGVAATSDAARNVVLNALAGQSQPQVVGAGAHPDVVTGTAPLDFAALAADLAGRATVTLRNTTVTSSTSAGSATAPVIAYAPQGTYLASRFKGYGVLVVDGSLRMGTEAQWVGLVIVRPSSSAAASFYTSTNGVLGGVALLGDARSSRLELVTTGTIRYSRAALALAQRAAYPQN